MPRAVVGGGTGDSRAGAGVDRRGTTAAAEEGAGRRAAGEGSAAEGAGLGDGGEEDVAEESLERNTVEEGGADEGWGEGDPQRWRTRDGRASDE